MFYINFIIYGRWRDTEIGVMAPEAFGNDEHCHAALALVPFHNPAWMILTRGTMVVRT